LIAELIIYAIETDHWIRIFGAAIDLLGVMVIIGRIVWPEIKAGGRGGVKRNFLPPRLILSGSAQA
jgi:hypothetical protein